MHFQVINDKYYGGILQRLKECIPEFTSVFDDKDGIYPVLGELGSYIINNINNTTIVYKAIGFINEAIEQGGVETEDAIVLQLFQKFYDNTHVASQIKPLLSEDAREVFLRFLDADSK